MLRCGRRIDHGKHRQAADQHDGDEEEDHWPDLETGHTEMVAGTEYWHAANLPDPPSQRQLQTEGMLETTDGISDIHGLIPAMNEASPLLLPRTVVLVGLMGAGKSAIGRRLALHLDLPFVDADDEIERAAGCSIAEFFERFGEAEFRNGERRVIARLLEAEPHVLSTGGGAYIDPQTRALMREKALTVWLRADLDVLFDRVKKRTHRPLLQQGNPREILGRLMDQRYPIYAEADLVVESTAQSPDRTTEEVIEALRGHLFPETAGAAA
jgi:shikimate kinase